MKYTPIIEFTLIAHDVKTHEHVESGPATMSLGDNGWTGWCMFGHAPNKLFGDLMLGFTIAIQDVGIDNDYARFKFATHDVNRWTLTPTQTMSVYIGEQYSDVRSYVQYNKVLETFGDENAYLFGVRARRFTTIGK